MKLHLQESRLTSIALSEGVVSAGLERSHYGREFVMLTKSALLSSAPLKVAEIPALYSLLTGPEHVFQQQAILLQQLKVRP